MTTDLEFKEVNSKDAVEKAKLEYNGTTIELPVVEGTEKRKL